MTFVQLYGVELDRELASSSTTLFTTARRKAAINAAQLEWAKKTECFQRQISFTLIDARQEYDLEAATDFAGIAKQGVSIKIVSGSNTRYIEGDDLRLTSAERLSQEEPGWRAVDAGTPRWGYLRRTGGTVNLGLHPAPSISGSDVWSAVVQIVMVPTDMSADTDEPFTCSGNPIRSLRPFHRALVHYAAYDLEKFRKDTARGLAQFQLFNGLVEEFLAGEKPKGGQVVRMARNYRPTRSPLVPARRWDPRT